MTGPIGIARRAGSNTARAARRAMARAALPRAGGWWVSVRLAPPLEELPLPRFSLDPDPGFLEVLETLDAAAGDPEVDGVFVELSGAPSGWSRIQSLRRALEAVRERGKPVAVYAESLDAGSFLLASAATRIWLPETGRVFLIGLRADGFYLRELLSQFDVRPEVVRIGSHKTAAESLTRDHMSPEHREQLEALADDLYGALVDGIATGRGLSHADVRDLIDHGPYGARGAVEAGLVDACVYPDELEERLEDLAPVPPSRRSGPRRAPRVDARVYHSLRVANAGRLPLVSDLPRLAYVVAQGAIHRGGGSRGIASQSLGALLERARRDAAVRGVVLRIESPGGDALASDLLWRQISRLRREKPVVATMGDVAASGGYYLASAADVVFAEAGTVTGSIGVIGGKLNLEGLYRRIGVGRDAVERGARAGLLSEARSFTEDERRVVRAEMAELYAAFVDRVARGRGLAAEAVRRVAEGRVWSGSRAISAGLVDALGGPLEALREARARAGLSPGERAEVDLLPRHPRLPGLRSLLRMLR